MGIAPLTSFAFTPSHLPSSATGGGKLAFDSSIPFQNMMHRHKPGLSCLERVMGIEPTQPAWKAGALPLSYTRISGAEDGIRTRDFDLGKVALYH